MEVAKLKKVNTTKDVFGNVLKIGSIIKTLSAFQIRKVLPPGSNETEISRVANKTGVIHEISGNKIYVELHGEQCYARIRPEATVFRAEGMTRVIGDGSVVQIGSLVQVLPREDEVRKLAGTSSWIHGMGDTCGKTGRIVRILEKSDVLVQFAWGPRFYFKPAALLQSSSDKIETQDVNGKWIAFGSLIEIKKSRKEFLEIQRQNHLLYDQTYAELPSKTFTVKGIRLKAFSTSKTVVINYKGSLHLVHVGCVSLTDTVQDRKGNYVSVDDSVQLLHDEDQLKSLQKDFRPEFGGWVDEMSKVLGKVGTVTKLCIDDKSGSGLAVNTMIMVKVEFPHLDLGSDFFYFDPRAIKKFTRSTAEETQVIAAPNTATQSFEDCTTVAARPTILSSADDEVQLNGIENENEYHCTIMKEISRRDLKCFEKLGKGGMGCVVRGEWTTSDGKKKSVAIKQVFDGITKGADFFGGILEEAKIQFSLRHPNIVTLLGISLEDSLWIVMDLVEGTDLSRLLFGKDQKDGNNNDRELTFKQKVKLSLDMCNAIAYIHHKNYVHCDIKPHNMMVDGRGKLYVCDFGITKFLGSMDFMTFATQYTNSVSGTLFYIAPECIQRSRTTGKYRRPTFASDVWSLGSVFFEIFTHKYLCEDPLAFVQDKSTNNDRLVRKQLLRLPRQVISIVSKSLDFNYTARPTAQDLSEFFHELLISQV